MEPQKIILQEYRCPSCGKLLCKGMLTGTASKVEVKCRGCGKICIFCGEDAKNIVHRSELIKEGLILDTERN